MANATARVPMATTRWGDDKIQRTTQSTTGTTYYPGQMMARINASGLADHASDSAGITFDGINAESDRVQVFSGDTAGRPIKIERPWRFGMAIASAAAGDEGKKVYVADNQTVSYSSGVNSVLVGFVDQVLSSTYILINPLYAPLNPVSVSNNVLAFAGATGVDQITFPSNLADALSFAQGSNLYLTFVTTTGSELTAVKAPAATGATTAGGGITLTAGAGGATSGTGGSIVAAGGAGTAGNSAGGLVSYTAGAGQGSAAGGAGSLVGGAGGATGAGGAIAVTGGAGGATSGTGGAVVVTGGAGTNGNAVGGACTFVAGAGQGTGAGAVAGLTGGASGAGATGNGGLSKIVGGAALSTNGTGGAAQVTGGVATGTGTGGAVTIVSGASAGASGTAGNVTIDTGSAAGGTGGIVVIGGTSASGTFINRGPLKSFFFGQTTSALGTTQNSTPTAAQLLGGIVTQTGATGAGTFTLPSGTTLSAAMPATQVTGDSFECIFANLGGGQTITITGATGTTVLGTAAVPTGKFAIMMFTNTGANTWNIYCLVSA